MKLVRFPSKNGPDWWVVAHSLSYRDSAFKNIRLIHVLTLVAQHLVSRNRPSVFRLSSALENKMFATRHNLSRLRSSIAKIGDPMYDGQFAKDYDSTQEIIADLEAYLNSIYSVLEIVAKLNKCFDGKLPQGFRKQATKYKPFSFKYKKWLKIFYDVRAELTHYNSPLPLLESGCILIDFQNPSELEFFKKGKHRIKFIEILDFYCELVKLLDRWAADKLKGIDKKIEIDVCALDEKKKKNICEKVKIRDIIKMTKSCNISKKGKFI